MAKDRGLNKEVIKRIKERLEKGQRTYNKELTLNDTRNYLKEAVEEALDLVVYLAAHLIRLEEEDGKDL
jgi:hypothetical protein